MTSIPDWLGPPTAAQPGPGAIFNQTATPVGATDGDLWWNPTTQEWRQRQGGAWVVVAMGGGGGAALPAATQANELLIATGPGVTWAPELADEGRY